MSNNQGSPGTKNIIFAGRDKAAEVALRRQLQEKEREAKLEAKRKQQEEKLRRIAEQKNNELQLRMKLKAQKELEKAKAVLDRRAAQLEQDKVKKQEILQKAHASASRTAQVSPKKVFAFGSSTPRELSYLERLSKDQKQYNKKLLPPEGSSNGPSPTSSPPRQLPSRKGVMTASLYVPSKSPSKPVTRARINNANSPKTTNTNIMTQSLYSPLSKTSQPRRNPAASKPIPPKRTVPTIVDSRKPPIPTVRQTKKPAAPSNKPKSIVSKKTKEVISPKEVDKVVEKPNVNESLNDENIEVEIKKENEAINKFKEENKVAETHEMPIIKENDGPEVSPFVELIAEPVAENKTVAENVEKIEKEIEQIETKNEMLEIVGEIPKAINQEADQIVEQILDSVVETLSHNSKEEDFKPVIIKHEIVSVENPETDLNDNSSTLKSAAINDEAIVEDENSGIDSNVSKSDIDLKQGVKTEVDEKGDKPIFDLDESGTPTDPSDELKNLFNFDEMKNDINSTLFSTSMKTEPNELETSRLGNDETTRINTNDDTDTRIESPDSGNALSTSSSPKESDSESNERAVKINEINLKSMERRARLSEIMSKVRSSNDVVSSAASTPDASELARKILEQRRQERQHNRTIGSDWNIQNDNESNNENITAKPGLSLAEEIKEAQREAKPSDILPGQPVYNNPEDPAQII